MVPGGALRSLIVHLLSPMSASRPPLEAPNVLPQVKNFDRPAGSGLTSTQAASRSRIRARASVTGQLDPRTADAIGLVVRSTTVPPAEGERQATPSTRLNSPALSSVYFPFTEEREA